MSIASSSCALALRMFKGLRNTTKVGFVPLARALRPWLTTRGVFKPLASVSEMLLLFDKDEVPEMESLVRYFHFRCLPGHDGSAHFSFDCNSDYRIEKFALYEDEAQFAPLAENLARRAAEEVARLRSLFPSVQATARHLAAKSPKGFWGNFHAGVACGLAGKTAQARRFFREFAATDEQQDWAIAAAALAREYSLAIPALPEFRLRIEAVIRRARELLRLPAVADVELE